MQYSYLSLRDILLLSNPLVKASCSISSPPYSPTPLCRTSGSSPAPFGRTSCSTPTSLWGTSCCCPTLLLRHRAVLLPLCTVRHLFVEHLAVVLPLLVGYVVVNLPLLKEKFPVKTAVLLSPQKYTFCQIKLHLAVVLNRVVSSVTRLGYLLDFRQLFKAFGNNWFAHISHILREILWRCQSLLFF